MGGIHSKISPFGKVKEQVILDPRSPSENINRSPINEYKSAVFPITKVRDLSSDLTQILDKAQTPDRFTCENMQSTLDPRSPGLFTRTPLVLGVSNVSKIAQGNSFICEDNHCDRDTSFGELSFKDCEDSPEVIITNQEDEIPASGNVFNDISFNADLKAEIDNIIQGLYDAGKDPRSPSIDIQRTPIVFEEDHDEHVQSNQCNEMDELVKDEDRLSLNSVKMEKSNSLRAIIHQDENELIVTPKQTKDSTIVKMGRSISRTPLSCVTNSKNIGSGNASDMRKTALYGQMKQNASITTGSGDAPKRKSFSRSKIPTYRLK